ncbi:MAG: triphosphoribosyl-dephospho-CoA synthase CitG [Candidatus Methanofastidiosia archaeon]
MKDIDMLGELATRSILLEASCHPKPGLVTPFSCGTHQDMDYTLFLKSSSVLSQGFYDIAHFSYDYEGTLKDMLPCIRTRGLEVEKRMFEVTNGVNTQKGLIFLFYLILSSSAHLLRQGELIPKIVANGVANITEGIVEKELGNLVKEKETNNLTKGEQLFLEYDITGIRGEVERGLPSVMEHGLPTLKETYEKSGDLNDALLQTLLSLMAVVEDTNIIFRGGIELFKQAQAKAREILRLGGTQSQEGREKITKLEKSFIKYNISPGGSADLLSATLFMYYIEKEL